MTTSLHRAALAFSLCLAVRGGATEAPLRVSMIPTTDPSRMLRDAQPLVARLEQATGRKVTLTIPLNYAAVVAAMVQGQVDLAHFGGLTFVQANGRAGAVPLVQRQRDRDFHSRFITARKDVRSLQDLTGRRFAFGDVNSTSGHLMPAYFMRKKGVDPAVIEQAIYTGGHDATALAVSEGRVDAGALDEVIWDRLLQEGKIDGSKVRVFWTTPPFVDYVWAARRDLDPALAKKLAQVFLALDPARPDDQPILELLSANCNPRSHSYDCDVSMIRLNDVLTQGKAYPYIKVNPAAYAQLRQAAIQEGLLR